VHNPERAWSGTWSPAMSAKMVPMGTAGDKRVEILPFHRLGFDKYVRLGMQPPLAGVEPLDDALIDRVRAQFARRGVVAR
jgi:pyruvate-formate lyase-activating enzyme